MALSDFERGLSDSRVPAEPVFTDSGDAFVAHGYVVITGIDSLDKRGVALEFTPSDARMLARWINETFPNTIPSNTEV